MNTILVPTDFSPAADNALRYALQLAALSGAEVVALHTVSLPLPAYAVQPEGMLEYNQYRVQEVREHFAACHARYGDSGRFRTVLVNGRLVDSIVEKAQQYDADLVVMGTRGAEGIRTFIGTNAAAVLAACPVPVLVVPEAYAGGLPARIVLAVQQEERESLLAPVFRLRGLCGAGLRTVHFTEEETSPVERSRQEYALGSLSRKWQQDFGSETVESALIAGADFNETLERYVHEEGVNLVAMITHRKKGLPGIFQKSLTRERAFHTGVPLLSLHA
ncbi:MAG: universal stress protein [Chitinophagaceae bacterium]|nr:MAG: universal stress protein [Chitinophagaceae bacterium]